MVDRIAVDPLQDTDRLLEELSAEGHQRRLYSLAVERRAHPIIGLLVVASLARLLSLRFFHPLNWDEIEYFRAADWIRQGLVPYRDFWEHHTPLQWFVFAPLTALVSSPGSAGIIAMRWAQVLLWIATFVLLSLWMRRAGISLP